jgi:hypothetical protein
VGFIALLENKTNQNKSKLYRVYVGPQASLLFKKEKNLRQLNEEDFNEVELEENFLCSTRIK